MTAATAAEPERAALRGRAATAERAAGLPRSGVSIVVPASGERTAITHLLTSLVDQGDLIDVEVVVVANGPDDGTAEAAEVFAEPLAAAGAALRVARIEEASKPGALNVGDSLAGHRDRIYLDADVVLAPGSITDVRRALDAATARGEVLLCAPRIVVRPSASAVVGAYADVWTRMPYTNDHVPGVGCYAVNAAGRRRWGAFPDIGADDKFVRLLFSPGESTILGTSSFTVSLPESALELALVRGRWTYNNLELAHRFPDLVRPDRTTRRATWRHLRHARTRDVALFAVVWAVGYLVAALRAVGLQPRWYRSGSSHVRSTPVGPAGGAVSGPRPLVVVVVSFRTPALIVRCISSIIDQLGPDDRVVVVDNASGDGSVELVRERFPHPAVEIVENATNVGFARACNQAAAGRRHDVVLLNSDAVAEAGMLEALRRRAGSLAEPTILGGCALDADGSIDVRSCGRAPTPWSVACFATGLSSALKRRPIADPECIATWDRSTTRRVEIVTGAMMYVPRVAWDRLGGFDERYFVYGEDVDLCLRAQRLAIPREFVPEARFTHVGQASSDPATMRRLLLQGRITAILAHESPRRAELMRRLTVGGCALRAAIYATLGRDSSWRDTWRDRARWRHGYPAP
ncbi:glycosyltransferase [Ilumatobacter sp.]|uniref:glycosyltransferase n=1 Tax=Ilumatobacter sp. TaxID=1967498 RepID=UPI003B52D030